MNRLRLLFLPKFSKEECEENEFHIESIELTSGVRFVFTQNFEAGEEVYYLGHDGVGGFYHGDKITSNEELVSKRYNLQFYKLMGRLKNY